MCINILLEGARRQSQTLLSGAKGEDNRQLAQTEIQEILLKHRTKHFYCKGD